MLSPVSAVAWLPVTGWVSWGSAADWAGLCAGKAWGSADSVPTGSGTVSVAAGSSVVCPGVYA